MLLTGIRNSGLWPYLLIPVVPSDKHVSACASTASTCLPSGDLYTKNKKLFKLKSFCHDQSGNRTRVYAVRGRRLDRLTNRPKYFDFENLEATRFELATSASRTLRSTKLSHASLTTRIVYPSCGYLSTDIFRITDFFHLPYL